MTEQLGDSAADAAVVVTPTQKLRDRLSAFRFNEELTPSLRRSPRNHGRPLKFEEEDSSLPAPGSSATPRKRARSEQTAEVDGKTSRGPSPKKQRSESVPVKRRKEKRGIAPPEKYAHLNALSDHLGEGADVLDVMFCGINPGQLSATIGHHFAHPTNHFWKCLHASQFTDRLLDPREDHILPLDYHLGLTNLVERPSASAAELANTEFTAGVPALLRKIVQKRPRIVCFVGKGIWDSFVRAVAPSLPSASVIKSEGVDNDTDFTMEASTGTKTGVSTSQSSSASSSATTTRAPSRARVKRTVSQRQKPALFVYDLQPYKIVHTAPDAAVRETLFSVVVSTSGLVASHQLPEKVKQFAALKQRVAELKSGTLDTSSMTVLPVPNTLSN